jgi:pyruvate carboxylase
LVPQAEALGLKDRFTEITEMYAKVNQLFGDIIKVTPSSKVVGDMAQYLVSNNLSIADFLEKGDSLSLPESVKSFFRGDLGQPVDGFPKDIQKIVLRDEKPYTDRPNAHLEPVDFDKEFAEFKEKFGDGMDRELLESDFLSYKLYPKVFEDLFDHYVKYGKVMNIPTKNFFYGIKPGEEIIVELDPGKTLLIYLVSVSDADDDGMVTVFFKVNGQTRNVEIKDDSIKVEKVVHQKAEKENDRHMGAPLQGSLSSIMVEEGDKVKKNQELFVIEAMKMGTTITANISGTVKKIHLSEGTMVKSDDLVVEME